MLFITVDEVRKRFPEAVILFATYEELDLSDYKFKAIRVNKKAFDIAAGGYKSFEFKLHSLRDYIRGKHARVKESYKIVNELKNVDLIIDISGFAIGDKWDKNRNEYYLSKLNFARKRHIPFYMMPQSIGPFEFEKNMSQKEAQRLRRKFSEALQYPKIIFAREQNGVDCLASLGITKNVRFSNDLVLQNSGIDLHNIFITPPTRNYDCEIQTSENVAIIPNQKVLQHGDEQKAIAMYNAVINHLIELGKNVYIIRHTNDDADLCTRLYKDVETLHLINQDLSCLEYNELIKQFDFIVCSRFHGLVHALRNNVPGIALGWAVKYKELLASVGQEKYSFNATNEINSGEILQAIDDMSANLANNKAIIAEHLRMIRETNCFDFLDELSNQDAFTNYRQKFQRYAFIDCQCKYYEQYQASITRLYHTIEKGLAYENYRPGFGKDNVEKLVLSLEKYVETGGNVDTFFYETALSCLHEYIEKNKLHGYQDSELEERVNKLPGKANGLGGTITVKTPTCTDFVELVKNRHSIRHFLKEPVDINTLKNVIELAQFTPSACNRQGWRTRIIADKDKIARVLANQNGNKGFGNEFDKLLVITADLRAQQRSREFFQAFIDGGMYAMNILNALFYKGIGSVPLSASLTIQQDKNVRKIISLDDAEVLILFIGVGNYPDGEFLTTKSERRLAAIEVMK